VRDMKELIALAKSKPDQLTYGSSGTGTVHHLSMEALKAAAGLKITHIPFKGTAQSVPALAQGETSLAVAGLQALAAFLPTGQVKILSTNTKGRSRLAPEIPSMTDIGFPDIDFPGELALFAPAGTPEAIIARLTAALKEAVNYPDLEPRFLAAGVEASYSTPEELSAIVKADISKYAEAVKVSGAKVE
jgi:tripartite-type tricarboxylate transporter receptor subunit TctC